MANDQDIFEEATGPSKECRVLGAVAYIPMGFMLPYFLGKGQEPFVAFHVRQGASFFFIALLLSFVVGFWIWILFLIVAPITGYNAYMGERYMMGFVRAIVQMLDKAANDDDSKK